MSSGSSTAGMYAAGLAGGLAIGLNVGTALLRAETSHPVRHAIESAQTEYNKTHLQTPSGNLIETVQLKQGEDTVNIAIYDHAVLFLHDTHGDGQIIHPDPKWIEGDFAAHYKHLLADKTDLATKLGEPTDQSAKPVCNASGGKIVYFSGGAVVQRPDGKFIDVFTPACTPEGIQPTTQITIPAHTGVTL